MASYNYYLKDSKSKTVTPIYLLFDDGVNRCKLYVQQSVTPKDWNAEKQEARKSLQGFSDFNFKLNKIRAKCEALHTELTKEGKFTVEILKVKFKTYLDELNNRKKQNTTGENKTFENLSDFAKHYIDSVEKTKNSNTILHNRQTLRLLKEFETEKRRKVTFERVNLDFYNDFVEFLTGKKLSPNTIGKHIRNLKLFLNEATERGINTKFDYKSKRFKALSEKVETIYLTEEELERIYEHDFSNSQRLERTRDLFLVGCYTGLRFSDFSQLKPEHFGEGEITIRTQKTNETVVIPIHPIVRDILKKYSHTAKSLPRPLSNQKMNEYLKEIGKVVGIDEKILRSKTKGGLRAQTTVSKFDLMTTHTARRSFATNLYLSGFPSISIMKITGHKTEKAFMSYIRISQEENAKRLSEHWNKNIKLKVV